MIDLICKTCGKAIDEADRIPDTNYPNGYRHEHRSCRYERLPKYWRKSKAKAKAIWLAKVAAVKVRCRKCEDMPWRRPTDGSPCRCGEHWEPEVIEVALWRDSMLGGA